MNPVVVALTAAAGAAVGRGAAVAVERVPLEEPAWRRPPSCLGCGAPRAAVTWLPVLGGLLAGPCATCGERRPRWEVALDVAMATVFGLLAWRFDEPVTLLAYLVFGAMLVTLSAIDLQTLRLPDRLTFPAFLVGIPLLLAAGAADDRVGAMVPALVGALAYFGVLLLTHLIYPRGMGFGDVKLAAAMGLHLGWLRDASLESISLVLYAMVLGFGAGSVAGLVVVAVRRRSAPYPFGPFLALGALVGVLLSESLGR